jgi:hypothetical protein
MFIRSKFLCRPAFHAGFMAASLTVASASKTALGADSSFAEARLANLPAVSVRNYSIGAYGAYGKGGGSGAGLGSVTMPLGAAAGAQLDGMFGVDDNGQAVGQAESHLFRRDPSRGMLGLYGAYIKDSEGHGRDGFRAGAEGEAYLGHYTLSGLAGRDIGKHRMFGSVKASAYATDNTKVYGMYRYEGKNIGAIGAEHLFAAHNVSLFVDAQLGRDGHRGVLAGLRFYLGGHAKTASRSLLQRDREDVVPLWLQANINGDKNRGKSPAVAERQTPVSSPTNAGTPPASSQPVLNTTHPPISSPTNTGTPSHPVPGPTPLPTPAPSRRPVAPPCNSIDLESCQPTAFPPPGRTP